MRIILFSLLMFVASSGCTRQEEAALQPDLQESLEAFTLLKIGDPVPAYDVISTDSEKITLGANKQLTLINLWAPWCGPCRQEFPYLEQIYKEHGPKGLRIIAVDVDADPMEVVSNFKEEYEITFTVAVDLEGNIQDRYKALGLPTSYLIDSDGKLLEIWTGMVPSSIKTTIQKHLDI